MVPVHALLPTSVCQQQKLIEFSLQEDTATVSGRNLIKAPNYKQHLCRAQLSAEQLKRPTSFVCPPARPAACQKDAITGSLTAS